MILWFSNLSPIHFCIKAIIRRKYSTFTNYGFFIKNSEFSAQHMALHTLYMRCSHILYLLAAALSTWQDRLRVFSSFPLRFTNMPSSKATSVHPDTLKIDSSGSRSRCCSSTLNDSASFPERPPFKEFQRCESVKQTVNILISIMT